MHQFNCLCRWAIRWSSNPGETKKDVDDIQRQAWEFSPQANTLCSADGFHRHSGTPTKKAPPERQTLSLSYFHFACQAQSVQITERSVVTLMQIKKTFTC